MNLIVNIDNRKFSLNGIQYFKNYISNVAGENLKIINAYDSNDVLLDWVNYTQISVNGVVYSSIALLQQNLIDVCFNRAVSGTTINVAQDSELSETTTIDNKFVSPLKLWNWFKNIILGRDNIWAGLNVFLNNFKVEKSNPEILINNTGDGNGNYPQLNFQHQGNGRVYSYWNEVLKMFVFWSYGDSANGGIWLRTGFADDYGVFIESNGKLRIPMGAGAGKVFTSDADGLGTWEKQKEKYHLVFDNWIQGKDTINWYSRAQNAQNTNWCQEGDSHTVNSGTNVNNIFYVNTNAVIPFTCKLVNVVGRLKSNAFRNADLKFLNFTSDKINVFNIQEILNVNVPSMDTLEFAYNSNVTLPENSFITTMFKQNSGTVGAFNFYLILTFEKI